MTPSQNSPKHNELLHHSSLSDLTEWKVVEVLFWISRSPAMLSRWKVAGHMEIRQTRHHDWSESRCQLGCRDPSCSSPEMPALPCTVGLVLYSDLAAACLLTADVQFRRGSQVTVEFSDEPGFQRVSRGMRESRTIGKRLGIICFSWVADRFFRG